VGVTETSPSQFILDREIEPKLDPDQVFGAKAPLILLCRRCYIVRFQGPKRREVGSDAI
jgi:hypothetical protein